MSGVVPTLSPAMRERQSLAAIRGLRRKLEEFERARSEPIAIVGMSCRFPGGVTDPDSYWGLLEAGADAVAPIPAERLDVASVFDPGPDTPGKTYSRWAGLVDDVAAFDAGFFGISEREAAQLDPQQRLFLEGAWLALEHGGIAPTSLAGTTAGVFVGVTTNEYARVHDEAVAPEDISAYAVQGLALNAVSGRVAHTLGLHGPAIAFDTACSSSLVAIDRACRSLRDQECELALAGGVSFVGSALGLIAASRAGMLSASGRCRSFSWGADGFVRGEGCGVVVLKRLRDATASGDRVLAVIRGSAVNHDGPSSGLTVPSGLAQQALLRAALKAAGVSASEVGYVEAHGTGTALGDPIEAEALGAVFGGEGRDGPLLIGTVKTNLGHLESASGVAGLIKVVLSLRRGVLPGQLHFDAPSPHIRWDALRLAVVDRLQAWAPIGGRRIAGVSAFGFSGTNAHLVVEAAPEPAEAELRARVTGPERPIEILALSARSRSALTSLAERWVARLAEGPAGEPGAAEWRDLCHTAGVGRTAFAHRLSVRAADAGAARAALAAVLTGQEPPSAVAGTAAGQRPRIGFLFTGQGSQHAGMGAALAAASPLVRRLMDRADAALAGRLETPLGSVLRGEAADGPALLGQTLYTQPGLYVLEYALAELWRSLGIVPSAVLGHSLGEYVGCAVAGVFGFEEGLRLVADRARLMQELRAEGGMLAVAASEAQVCGMLAAAGMADEIALAGVNGPRQVTVSGSRRALDVVAAFCAAQGVRTHPLSVSQAFHSPLMEPMAAAFEAQAGEVAYSAPRLPVISNLTGAVLEGASAGYWRAHLRAPVRFTEGLTTLQGLGCDLLIELGPRPVLIQLARQAGVGARHVSSLRGPGPEGADGWDAFCQAVQTVYAAGAELDWAGWSRDHLRHRVDAPTTPFERRRHWISATAAPRVGRRAGGGPSHPLLGRRLRSALPGGQFEAELAAAGATAWLGEHRIGARTLLPASGLIEMMLAAGAAVAPELIVLEALSLPAPLPLSGGAARTVQTIVDAVEDGRARVRVFAAATDPAGIEASADAQGQLRFELHAEAWLAPAAAAPDRILPELVALDLAALRARCPAALEGAAHAERLARRGAVFGPSFRGLLRLWIGEGEALAEIVATVPPLAAGRPHPVLLDACLQAAAALVDGEDVLVPSGLERLTLAAAAWPERVMAHARIAGGDRLAPLVDFTIADTEGAPLARLARLRCHNLSRTTTEDLASCLYQVQWREIEPAAATATTNPVLIGAGLLADEIAAAFAIAGSAPFRGVPEPGLPRSEAARVVVFVPPPPHGGVSGVDRAGVSALLSLLRRHASHRVLDGARLYVVTRRLYPVRPGEATDLCDAALAGIATTVLHEFPALRCTRIDIDPTEASAARQIVGEASAEPAEDSVAYRDGRRFAPRLARAQAIPSNASFGRRRIRLSSEQGLGGLAWRPAPPVAPGPHELEIEVRAAPLNFRDVVTLVGLIRDGASLGSECAGIVTRIGAAVTRFRPGDPVVAITPASLASHVIAQEALTLAKPAALSYAAAAAQGLVTLTADHCLNEIAQVRPGTRVLIHGAAGGVGLAAVHLCSRLGAEIFATVGSEQKRALLRGLGVPHIASSRSFDFAAQFTRATGGLGVDVVLNSLAGPFVDAGLSLLAPGGRFIEIGKTDLRDSASVRAVRADIDYTTVDLTDRFRDEPAATMARLSVLLEDIAARRLPAVPHRCYPFKDASAAFRDLAAARHVGKLVLTPERDPASIRADGAYIVTGGAVGVGFATAEWLAHAGAGRVLLVGRRPPAPAIAERIAQWRRDGVAMTAIAADVGDPAAVARVVAEAGPALRGVFHCASVLDDAPVSELTWNRLAAVLHSKVAGGWNLHRATENHELDLFVLFSSWASIAGSRGGAGYAAANVALDSLAHLRRQQGLPALSINWGPWGETGWATRQPAGRAIPGFFSMTSAMALAAMALALQFGQPQIAIASIDWSLLATAAGRRLGSAFAELAHGRTPAADDRAWSADLLGAFRAAEPDDRHGVAIVELQKLAAAALGVDVPGLIDPDRPLQDFGLDSILAIDLRHTLARALRADLPATLLFDYPTLVELAKFCVGLLPQEAMAPVRLASPPAEDDDLLALIEGLSDDEVDARLSDRRSEAEAVE